MAVITPIPKTQFIGADGVPLAGGKVYTYAAGTTTPQSTYTDSTGGTANTNPIILDSRGEANIWLGDATYKFKLTDADNVEIWTVDYISAPTTAVSPVLTGNVTISTDSSSPALKITQTGTGYVMRVQDSADPDVTPFVITATGLVGIGTAAPANALDIDDGGAIQFSSSGTARTIISADATNSTIDVKDARNFVVKTNGSTYLTVSSAGATTLGGALTVSSGGAAITGNSSVTGTLTSSGALTVSSGGAGITGNSSVTGTLSATGNISTSTGNITATAGSITAGTSVTATTSVLTDTIAERTGGAGVTCAGVLLQSSAIAGDYLRMASKTSQAVSSGTSVSFTDIPTWARRITIVFSGVSITTNDAFIVQIGPSGGVATSGYTSSSNFIVGNSAYSGNTSSAGFLILPDNIASAYTGAMTIYLMNPSSYIYVASHTGTFGGSVSAFGGGGVTLSGLMTQLTIKTTGAASFDASGSANVFYE